LIWRAATRRKSSARSQWPGFGDPVFDPAERAIALAARANQAKQAAKSRPTATLELRSLLPYPNSCLGTSPHQQEAVSTVLRIAQLRLIQPRDDYFPCPSDSHRSPPIGANGSAHHRSRGTWESRRRVIPPPQPSNTWPENIAYGQAVNADTKRHNVTMPVAIGFLAFSNRDRLSGCDGCKSSRNADGAGVVTV
jgi:hypothetical protein